jgi:hypothetical protein
MSILLYTIVVVVALTLLAGSVAMCSLAYGHIRDVLRLHRGVATEVWCPRYHQTTLVRIGMAEDDHHLKVLTCERQSGGVMRCDAACFPALKRRVVQAMIAAG